MVIFPFGALMREIDEYVWNIYRTRVVRACSCLHRVRESQEQGLGLPAQPTILAIAVLSQFRSLTECSAEVFARPCARPRGFANVAFAS